MRPGSKAKDEPNIVLLASTEGRTGERQALNKFRLDIKDHTAMKIVAKVEKAGQVVAQAEFNVSQEDIRTSARKAFVRLLKVIPEESSLFDDDVRLKFEKVE